MISRRDVVSFAAGSLIVGVVVATFMRGEVREARREAEAAEIRETGLVVVADEARGRDLDREAEGIAGGVLDRVERETGADVTVAGVGRLRTRPVPLRFPATTQNLQGRDPRADEDAARTAPHPSPDCPPVLGSPFSDLRSPSPVSFFGDIVVGETSSGNLIVTGEIGAVDEAGVVLGKGPIDPAASRVSLRWRPPVASDHWAVLGGVLDAKPALGGAWIGRPRSLRLLGAEARLEPMIVGAASVESFVVLGGVSF